MPIRIDSQEQDWQRKISGGGIESLNSDYLPADAWDKLLEDNSLIQFPPDLGYNPELANYILFDVYDTGGQALEVQRSSFITSSEDASSKLGGLLGNLDPTSGELKSKEEELANLKQKAGSLAAGGVLGLLGGGLLGAVGGAAGVAWLESGGAENLISAFGAANKADTQRSLQGKGLGSFASTRLGFADKTVRTNLSIALPPTAQISSSYGIEYGETDLTGVMNLLAAAKAGQALAGSGENADTDEMKSLLRKVGSIPSIVTDGLSKIIGGEGLNLNEFQQAANRQTSNKFSEQLFKGVQRRSFSFSWELVPFSKEDVIRIYSIVYAFKKYSHPKMAGAGMFLDYPGQFKIGFFNGTKQNDFLFRIGMCACTKVDVTYGGKDLIFFRDFEATIPPFSQSAKAFGAPANSIKLSLEFTELELLTRERIQQGY